MQTNTGRSLFLACLTMAVLAIFAGDADAQKKSTTGVDPPPAQQASQECLDYNVKAHAEVLAEFSQKIVPTPATFTPPKTVEHHKNGVTYLGGTLFSHTQALRTPRLTAFQCAYMTQYIDGLRSLVREVANGKYHPIQDGAHKPPPGLPADAAVPVQPTAQQRAEQALDHDYYYIKYPDLQQRVGRGRAELLNHWLSYGRFELRAPSLAGDASIQSFENWQAGCMKDMWGQIRLKRVPTKGQLDSFVIENICDRGAWQFALAHSDMVPAPRSGIGRDYLRAGDYLKVGEYLVSNNKRFFASIQPDGNFCTYAGSSPATRNGAAGWCTLSKSAGQGPFYAVQQNDGNFCVYRGVQPPDNNGGVYCVFTASQGTEQPYYYAVLQDDANFAVNRGSSPRNMFGHLWDRVSATPPKPDTGLQSFWKGVQAVAADAAEISRQAAVIRAQQAPPGL